MTIKELKKQVVLEQELERNKNMGKKLKTFNVVWNEKMSVNIEATSREEAEEMAWNCEYDENEVSSEMDSAMEAYEMTKQELELAKKNVYLLDKNGNSVINGN